MINIKNLIPSDYLNRHRLFLPLLALFILITIVASATINHYLGHEQPKTAEEKSVIDSKATDLDDTLKIADKSKGQQSAGSSSTPKSTPSSNNSSTQSSNNSSSNGQSSSGTSSSVKPSPTPNPNPTPPPSYTPQPLFVGNFETGNFNQWDICQNVVYNNPCSGYNGAHYSLTVQSTIIRQGGWAARFEVRNGDQPFCCGERSEIHGGDALSSTEGQDRWYQWSTYFASGFPTNQGWSAIAQWHADADGSPPLAFHSSDDGLTNGYFGLIERRYNSPSQLLSTNLIWQTPQNPGNWHDIKIHVKWSASDSSSLIELWHNGTRQTFIGACAGQTQCKLRTMMPGGGDVYFKQGYYRDPNHTITGTVYHDGFSMAASEADLNPL